MIFYRLVLWPESQEYLEAENSFGIDPDDCIPVNGEDGQPDLMVPCIPGDFARDYMDQVDVHGQVWCNEDVRLQFNEMDANGFWGENPPELTEEDAKEIWDTVKEALDEDGPRYDRGQKIQDAIIDYFNQEE